MALASNLEAAVRARNLISERSPAAVNVTIPHILGLIPHAVELWVRDIISDPEKCEFLRKDVTVTLASGVGDLTDHVNGTSSKVSLRELRNATPYVTVSGVRTPMTWVGSQAQLNNSRLVDDVPAAYLEGVTLRTRNTDGSLTSLGAAQVTFNVTAYPTSVTTVPDALVGDFVSYLAEMAVKEKVVDGS